MSRRSELIEVFGVVGTKVRIDAQEYVAVRIEPVRIGGLDMVHWATHCAECGSPMEVFAPSGRIDLSRRCKAHAKPGRRARMVRTRRCADRGRSHDAAQSAYELTEEFDA